MRERIPLNFDWQFSKTFDVSMLTQKSQTAEPVDLPHTFSETPYNYFDESVYQGVCAYQKTLELPPGAGGKRVFLIVGAAAHSAEVYVNGKLAGAHKGGYTAFTAELTDFLCFGEENLLTIVVDSRETQNFPPFGNVIDYMTYGGLYREVWLEIREQSYIEDIFVKPRIYGAVDSEIKVIDPDGCTLRRSVYKDGELVAEGDKPRVNEPELWSVDNPALYTFAADLIKDGEVIDRVEIRFGFRSAKFKTDGFYLNGKKLKIVGLNRHQSYPYVGYAMPASMQRMDAEVLKNELGLNAVRTSHYPQSQHFIDRCDELGLLVFTELPGWQHIGDGEWQDCAVEMVREMVSQYRNHPSIILWGVRINESRDNDEFYLRTNEAAHSLDPTRRTSGVRCYKQSSLLEDVYSYNEFVHDGTNKGCEPKRAVTPDMSKPYLISEYCGHMFPSKSFDDEEHCLEQALRHARILNDIAAESDIAGSFGWCMADYNTHRDFGSGDRICYHGVCDMFRNKKLAAEVYSVRGSEPVLEISSSMDIGEHPAGNRGRIVAFTNADSVRFYKNDRFVREFTHENTEFPQLCNPPIEINDLIGDLIDNEGFDQAQAECVRDILNDSARSGMNNLSTMSKLKALWLTRHRDMTFEDAYQLYGKYIGDWGGNATEYRFEAVKDGEIVKTVKKTLSVKRFLEVKISSTELVERDTYDAAALRIRAVDENGNLLRYLTEAVNIKTEGDIRLIGPPAAILRGGMGGAYIRTNGKAGKAAVILSAEGFDEVKIEITVRK